MSTADGWRNKMWSVQTMKCYWAIEKREIPLHGTKWVNLENIRLHERNQTKSPIYCVIP